MPQSQRVHVIRPVDLSRIEAIGFDLDHTLAVYDDERVNAIACRETCETLASEGIPRVAELRYDESRVCRGLLIDTALGAVLKADHRGLVRRARRHGCWHDLSGIARDYPDPVDASGRFHPIDTPFDLPTAFLYQALAAPDLDPLATCRLIRTHLDRAHTRGHFKRAVLDDVGACVHRLGFDPGDLESLRDRTRRLFVLTNSDAAYTCALLDHLFGGPRWGELFDLVAAGAAKPAFFEPLAATPATPRGERVVEGAHAAWVERELGVSGAQILYIGDSAAADIGPARSRGWRTAQVVPELAGNRDEGMWGPPLSEDGEPTWFAARILRHADLYANSLADIVALPPRAALVPAPHPLQAP